MSKRSDIKGSDSAHIATYGLIYTEVLGWIDLGHAQGTDIQNLLRDIDLGERQGKEYYDVSYSQSMAERVSNIKMGKFIKWRIKRGRTLLERRSIALAMMMSLARKFEGLRRHSPLAW